MKVGDTLYCVCIKTGKITKHIVEFNNKSEVHFSSGVRTAHKNVLS